MYEIEITYKTGHSLESWTETDTLGYVWENIEDAKETLRRVKEVNEYERMSSYRKRESEPPKCVSDANYGMMVPDNSGGETQVDTFWTGYFDRLKIAKIILSPLGDEDLVYNPNGYIT